MDVASQKCETFKEKLRIVVNSESVCFRSLTGERGKVVSSKMFIVEIERMLI